MNGPWTLNDRSDYSQLVNALNDLLVGSRLVVTHTDTIDLPGCLSDTGWRRMHGPVEYTVRPHGSEIYIPIGLGISLGTTPMSFDGSEHPTVVDVVGDHVQIIRPYLFHLVPQRVDTKVWSITATGRHE